jgi:hypothetical protein
MLKFKSMFLAVALVIIALPAWAITVNVIDEKGVNNCNNCEFIDMFTENGVLIINVSSGSTTTEPVNGQCGSASGGTFSTKPTSNLCSAGTAGTVSGSGPWTWTCNGLNGGSDSPTCSANYQAPVTDSSCKQLPADGLRNMSINAHSTLCYYITLPSTSQYYNVYVAMGTMDWKSNQDMLIKKGSAPTKAEYDQLYYPGAQGTGPSYWYVFRTISDETVQPLGVVPDNYYILIYNRGAIDTGAAMTGKFDLIANWYEVNPPTSTSIRR